MMTQQDVVQITSKGLTTEQIDKQLEQFRTGFPYLNIESAASVGNGIVCLDSEEENQLLLAEWQTAVRQDHLCIYKFVPASGAATRMFKDLFEFLSAQSSIDDAKETVLTFFNRIHDFAFFEELDAVMRQKTGNGVDCHIGEGHYCEVVKYLLEPCGLGYGSKPKGLLSFHLADGELRTAAEEHLVEACCYASDYQGVARVHYTVSEEHLADFKSLMERVVPRYEERYGKKIEVSFSVQKPSTDTIAVTMDNQPFRNDDGSLLFRPGGHGALIENLNDLADADIVFIRNIDNVVPDREKGSITCYEQLMAGLAVHVSERARAVVAALSCPMNEAKRRTLLSEVKGWCENTLRIKHIDVSGKSVDEQSDYFLSLLRRPVRVCGMVCNEGEPGGGPFYCYDKRGVAQLQILESSQIDKSRTDYDSLMAQSSHFNPVDIVCCTRNADGGHYDLTRFVDQSCGFISSKSKNGRDLKALELPGLWNGAMSDWISVFVEIPLANFNPVKVVNDLLRPQHQ